MTHVIACANSKGGVLKTTHPRTNNMKRILTPLIFGALFALSSVRHRRRAGRPSHALYGPPGSQRLSGRRSSDRPPMGAQRRPLL